MHLVEPLHFFFHGAELGQAWRNLLNDGGIAAEIEVAGEFEELGEGLLCRSQVVRALPAKLLGGCAVGAEDQVGLQATAHWSSWRRGRRGPCR